MNKTINIQHILDFIQTNNMTQSKFCRLCRICPSTYKRLLRKDL